MIKRFESNCSHNKLIYARCIQLICGCVGMLFIGIIFSWSSIKVPLREELHYTAQQLAVTYTVSLCFFCIGNLITGLTLKRLGFRLLGALSAALIVSGFSLTAGISAPSPVLLCAFYGAAVGSGIGICYNCILSTASAWFPDKKGMCSGLLMMCFGISSMLWSRLALWLFDTPEIGWRGCYTTIGVTTACIVMLCALIMHFPANNVTLLGTKPSLDNKNAISEHSYTGKEVLRMPSFWFYYLYGICTAAVGTTVLSFVMDAAKALGASDAFGASMVGIAAMGNGLGRVLCGLTYDRFGRKRTFLFANCVTVAAPALMLIALPSKSLFLAGISFLLSGLSFGCCPTISSALMSSFYGMKYFPINYSLSNSKMIFSSLGASCAGILLDRCGGYAVPYIMLLTLSICACFLCRFIKKP